MADGYQSARSDAARKHLVSVARKCTEEQVVAIPGILLWLLVGRLSIMDVEQCIDAAVREAKVRHPKPIGARRG